MSETTPKQIAHGVAWVGLASSLVAAFDLVAFVLIIKYWVTRAEFGHVSLVVTAFGALQLIAELGLPAALVQRGDHTQAPDQARLSTMFWLGLLGGGALYAIVWFAAPLVYDEPIVTDLFRVVGLVLLIRPFYTTHQALLRRRLAFKELSGVRMVANFVEFSTKLGIAIAGGGVWAFALGPIARELTYAIGVPLRARWWPSRIFQPRLVGPDFRFGWRSSGGELLFQIYSNIDYQIVGRVFDETAVGSYRAAKELVLEPVRFVSNVVTVVAFPTFARLRSDRSAVIDQYVTFTRQNLVVVLVLLSVVVVDAHDVITVLVGAQYADAAEAARILAIVGVFRALSHLGPPLLDGLGRPNLSLRYHVTATLALGMAFAVAAIAGDTFFAFAVAWAVAYPIAFGALQVMVFAQLGIGVAAYLRRVGRIVVWVALAAGAGLVVHALLGDARAGVRLAASGGVVIGGSLALLARYEGFSPAAIARSLRR